MEREEGREMDREREREREREKREDKRKRVEKRNELENHQKKKSLFWGGNAPSFLAHCAYLRELTPSP